MNYHIMTLFPQMVLDGLNTSIIGRAIEKNLLSLDAINIRDYTGDKHKRVDDAPYGGGAGLVMQAAPICEAYEALCRRVGKRPRVLYMTPQGQVFNQTIAGELAQEEELVFLCGHYEGVDERALELIVTDYLSVGDYVLTGGELPAMMMIDCISRLIPGVLHNDVSAEIESFHDNLLEYPQYTRPEIYQGMPVPEVLLTGHHQNIEIWRRRQSIVRTLKRRPDLLEKAKLSEPEQFFLQNLREEKSCTVHDYFDKLFERMKRREPGSTESTRKALEFYPVANRPFKILDIGCGVGIHTFLLAEAFPEAEITAIDKHAPDIPQLNKGARKRGFSDRICGMVMSMSEMVFADESFDLIWAEGAFYNTGFESAIKQWKQLLKPGGYLIGRELSWLKPAPSEESRSCWQEKYPGIDTVENKIKQIEAAGYFVKGHYICPKTDWTKNYYNHLQKNINRMREDYMGINEAMEAADMLQEEIDFYRVHSDEYSYVFYAMERNGK